MMRASIEDVTVDPFPPVVAGVGTGSQPNPNFGAYPADYCYIWWNAQGATAHCRFGPVVPVVPTVELILDLVQDVIGLNLQQGIENSLDAKLDSALEALQDANDDNDVSAMNRIDAFINAVNAQSGGQIDEADAAALIAAAEQILSALGQP